MYDLVKVKNRIHSGSVKWDSQSQDVLPMWIADMDFETAAPILEAIKRKVDHGIFGYALIPEDYYEAEVYWWKKRHDVEILPSWIDVSTGIIPSLSAIVQAFCQAGDQVMIQNPVYNYFTSSIKNNACEVVVNELVYDKSAYTIDFEDFERKASDERCKLFILCNPHNPVGRVWTLEELTRMGQICLKHQVIVVVDEAHRDIVHSGYKHIPFMSINDAFKMQSITCTSPGKTFNLAGLKVANIISANAEFLKKINRSININEVIEPNVFGIVATIAAYKEGQAWLDQVLDLIKTNIQAMSSFISDRLPELKMIQPEGTYLIWLDCKSLGLTSEALGQKLLEEGLLRVNPGQVYGQGGEGFIRLNIACSQENLMEGLKRLEKVIRKL